jgi:hypothetical protein
MQLVLFRAPHLATDTAAFWFWIRWAGAPSTASSGTPRLWCTVTGPANVSGDVGGLPTG